MGARSFWLSAAAVAAVTAADGAIAAPDPATEDARLARLEAAVASLQAQVAAQQGLRQENAALRQQVGALQTKVAALQSARIQTAPALPPPPQPGPTALRASLTGGPPRVATDDGRFSANLYALVQLDGAEYFQAAPGPLGADFRRSGPALGFSAANVDLGHARNLRDGTLFRRARIGVWGKAFGDFQYRAFFDFGGSGAENAGQLYEAWIQYSGLQPLKLRVGAFPPLQGLADQDSTAAQPLLERAASADVARNLAAGDTRIAAQLWAAGDHWLASGAVTGRTIGVVASTGTGVAPTYGDQLAFVGRVAVSPLYGRDWLIHIGAHGSYVDHPADTAGPSAAGSTPASAESVSLSDQAELRIDGTKLINTGNIDARHADEVGAEFAAQWRSFLLQSEYEHFDVQRAIALVTDPHFDGWYVEASWVPVGRGRRYNSQTAAFDAPPVPRPVGAGGWGTVELAARYAEMNLNYHAGPPGSAPTADAIRGGDLRTWAASVNWWLTPTVRVAIEGQHVTISRLSPDATSYQTPTGAQIGQSYDAVAVRTQFGF
ncbi:MAG TPA: porin [Caulobacteraceae bacterium]|nr:porin [Caulobacteraceae bacterium]